MAGKQLLRLSDVYLGTKADLDANQLRAHKLAFATDENKWYRTTVKGDGATVLSACPPEDAVAAAESITLAMLDPDSGVLHDQGRSWVNVLRVANDAADEEVVVIGGDTYEFDEDEPADVTEGNIRVDIVAAQTPAAATDALIAAINASGTEGVTAVDIGDNEVLIVSASGPLECSTDMAGADNAWAAEDMFGGAAPATKQLVAQTRVPNATEVALGNMHFAFPDGSEPVVVAVEVRVTATGVVVAWGGGIAVADNVVTLTNDTDPDWTADHTVALVVLI